MAQKKSANKMMIAVVVGVVALFVVMIMSRDRQTYHAMDRVPQYSPESAPKDGDSQADTIRALQAYAKEAVGKAEALNDRTQQQATTVLENRNHVQKLAKENQDLKDASQKLQEQAASLAKVLDGLQEELVSVKAAQRKTKTEVDEHGIPVGFGYDHLAKKRLAEAGQWFNPVDLMADPNAITTTATTGSKTGFQGLLAPPGHGAMASTSTATSTQAIQPHDTAKTRKAPLIDPRYTLPKDSILYDGMALTALLGRIPVEGTTPDPYPVKVFVGAENLAANGHQLPEVKGMLFSGWGIGDWNLSCVSARLHSATYIFEDGRIVNHTSEGKPLGYISDRYGWPCITGEFRTNAPKFLGQRVGLAALGAAGAAYAQAQFSKQKSGLTGNISTDLTGDIEKVVGGTMVESATNEVSQWLLARQKQSFDAVIVPPGASVSIHLERTLELDHAELARQVRYHHGESTTARTLD